jgi:hypothetical protein
MSSLLKIDELIRDQHYHLLPEDECYYLMEYTAHKTWGYSPANNLIYNCKKKMDQRGRPGWGYKAQAIHTIGALLKGALPSVIDFSKTTLVPLPPSKIKTNPLYDDRVLQILQSACPANAAIRELIHCRQDTDAAHESGNNRPSVKEIYANYVLDSDAARTPIHDRIVLFDDMITAGSHYAAAKAFIGKHFPEATIIGIFAARREIPAASSAEDFA